ncbi:translocator protein homolog [Malania oleifera]|uniref:translocator protein homolog n=1 Tax=Malania oleifera TaxID=397392 RepID=UPI0025ADA849|nr:translocator protein homolog [Malania oleifera]
MASSDNLKQRFRDDHTTPEDVNTSSSINRPRREKRMAMAKRGLRSLAIALAVPLALTLVSIYLSGSGPGYLPHQHKPVLLPPRWTLHLASLGSTFFAGLSGWLVWAEGGFHSNPTALFLYVAQMGLGFAWEPLVFGLGATRVGLVACVGLFGSLVACSRIFKEVNPIAGDMLKPCLGWAASLAFVNLKLVNM